LARGEPLVSGVLEGAGALDGVDVTLAVLSVLPELLVVLSIMHPPSLCRRDAAKA